MIVYRWVHGEHLSLGSLPDFELSELRLCPRVSAVDLGEVKPVRLKVDVHGVHTRQKREPASQNARKKSMIESLCLSLFLLLCPEISSPALWLKVAVRRRHHLLPRVVAGLQNATAGKASPSSSPPPKDSACDPFCWLPRSRHTNLFPHYSVKSARTKMTPGKDAAASRGHRGRWSWPLPANSSFSGWRKNRRR